MGDTQRQNEPQLCKGGCHFFGNPQTEGYCSKCYRDRPKDEEAKQTPIVSTTETGSTNATKAETPTPVVTENAAKPPVPPSDEQVATEDAARSQEPARPPVANVASAPDVASAPVANVLEEKTTADIVTGDATEEKQKKKKKKKKDKKRKKNRCHMCRKKLGLTAVKCRCGHLFCSKHRYGDTHECTFDYKTLKKDQITGLGGGNFSKCARI